MAIFSIFLIRVPKISLRTFHISSGVYIRQVIQASQLNFYRTRKIDVTNVEICPSQETNMKEDHDFYGIESDEGAMRFENVQVRLEKYEHLVGKKKRKREVVIRTPFGSIRRDIDNKGRYYGSNQKQSASNHRPEMKDSEKHFDGRSKVTTHNSHKGPHANLKFDADDERILHKSSKKKYKKMTETQILPADKLYSNTADEYSQSKVDLGAIDKSYAGNISNIMESNHITSAPEEDNLELKKETTNPCDNLSYIDDSYFGKEIDSVKPNNNTATLPFENANSNLETENHQSNIDLSYIDETYFGKGTNVVQQSIHSDVESDNLNMHKNILTENNDTQHVCSSDVVKESDPKNSHVTDSKRHDEELFAAQEKNVLCEVDLSEVDKQYFKPEISQAEDMLLEEFREVQPLAKKVDLSKAGNQMQVDSSDSFSRTSKEPPVQQLEAIKCANNKTSSKQKKTDKFSALDELVQELFGGENKHLDKEESKPDAKSDSKSAFEFVKRLRKTSIGTSEDGDGIKLDSKGFRILTNQVPDLSKLTRDELLSELRIRVLYSDDDLLVLDKPYNLVVHDAETNKEPCLSPLLDDLAHILDKQALDPKLITVHRLDKTTTGCLLLARNEITAQHIKSLFAQRKITKFYWILTAGVPEHMEGVIDIPVAEGTINNKTRMVLQPELPKDISYKSHCKNGKKAITKYSVIATAGNAALIEAQSVTGLKHQIRVHFGFGLNCPIIGDHKYSHLDKLAPQKLPSDILQKLGVRQSKVRHIPMHIHARSIIIPHYMSGRDLFVHAPLPSHMQKNMRSLKFRKK